MDRPESSALSFEKQFPYLLAAVYAMVVSVPGILLFPAPPPRFMDVYLLGMVFFAVRWSIGPAVLIYVLSLILGVWILHPRTAFAISEGHDVYRLCSYSATSLAVIWAIDYLRSRN